MSGLSASAQPFNPSSFNQGGAQHSGHVRQSPQHNNSVMPLQNNFGFPTQNYNSFNNNSYDYRNQSLPPFPPPHMHQGNTNAFGNHGGFHHQQHQSQAPAAHGGPSFRNNNHSRNFHQGQQQHHGHLNQQRGHHGQQHTGPITPARMEEPLKPLRAAILFLSDGLVEHKKNEVASLIASEDSTFTVLDLDAVDPGCNRLQKLESLLDKKSDFMGYVITNAITLSLFEFFTLDEILRRAQVRLETVVYFELEQSTTSVDVVKERVKHPIGFELFSKYCFESYGIYMRGADTKTPKQMVDEIKELPSQPFKPKIQPVRESLTKNVETLLPWPGVELETRVQHIVPMQEELTKILQLESVYASAHATPGRLLDYTVFTRWAHALRTYHATKLVDGDEALLVGYGPDAFLVMQNVGVVFLVKPNCLPPSIAGDLAKHTEGTSKSIHWVFAALLVDIPEAAGDFPKMGVLVSDMLYYQGARGSETYTVERLEKIASLFPKLDKITNTSPFACQEYFPIRDIKVQSEKPERFTYQGFHLVKPTPLTPGLVDNANFVIYTDPKKAMVRLWNGQLKDDMWYFEGHILSSNGNEEAHTEKVVIPDGVVSEWCLNNGNIVECVRVQAPPAKGGKGRQPAAPTYQLSYVRRKIWAVNPSNSYFSTAVFSSETTWPKESVLRSTPELLFEPMYAPLNKEEEEEQDEGEEEK